MKRILNITMMLVMFITINSHSQTIKFKPVDTVTVNGDLYIKYQTPELLSHPSIDNKQFTHIVNTYFNKMDIFSLNDNSTLFSNNISDEPAIYPCSTIISFKPFIWFKVKLDNYKIKSYNKNELLSVNSIEDWNNFIISYTEKEDNMNEKLFSLCYMICEKITYSKNNKGRDLDVILRNNETLCNGYSTLLTHSLNVLNIDTHGSIIVEENKQGGPKKHILNYVVIKNEVYYIDVTFMDTDTKIPDIRFFMFQDINSYLFNHNLKII